MNPRPPSKSSIFRKTPTQNTFNFTVAFGVSVHNSMGLSQTPESNFSVKCLLSSKTLHNANNKYTK